ncbi:MAG: DUF4290 domain-containing protein [Chlorobi bacterium]|nr:DUF4290 domain-containing protein [Chlorobiota bacterium]
MEYNTKRESMAIPEYGRNIHKMIDYCISIEDREKRNATAETIVRVMRQMNASSAKSHDFEHKLWDHLHIISGFNLDIDAPYPAPKKDEISRKPEKLEYSQKTMAFPHYGKHIEKIIDSAVQIPEGDQKDAIVLAIANYLKKSYLTWNRDSVNDETVLKHLADLSNGKLHLKEEFSLISNSEALSKPKKQKNIVNKKAMALAQANKRKRRRR